MLLAFKMYGDERRPMCRTRRDSASTWDGGIGKAHMRATALSSLAAESVFILMIS
jgi:hypothetical protein